MQTAECARGPGRNKDLGNTHVEMVISFTIHSFSLKKRCIFTFTPSIFSTSLQPLRLKISTVGECIYILEPRASLNMNGGALPIETIVLRNFAEINCRTVGSITGFV